MFGILALSLSLAAQDQAPRWLTFDVLNAATTGKHTILHLEDVLSSRADIPELPHAKQVLIYATTLDDCLSLEGGCFSLVEIAKEARAVGGLVLALLLDPAEVLPRARKEIPGRHTELPVIQDTHGIVRRALRIDRPSEIVVINSDGKIVRFSQPTETAEDVRRKLDEARRVFVGTLRRDKED